MNKYNFQVGDYCRHANGTIAIVAKVEKDRGFACKIGNSEYLWSYNNRFEPIPLTEEILEAIGFTMYYENSYQKIYSIFLNDDEDCVEYKFSIPSEDFHLLKIYLQGGVAINIYTLYFHELQHALRLCGLTDLANNLKLD